MKKKPTWKVPFDEGGNLMDWTTGENDPDVREWRENSEWSDTLTFTHASRGRSACHFHWKGKDGASYNMFLTDFESSVYFIEFGKLSGHFTFVKRGANYGVKLARPPTVVDRLALEA